MSDRPKATVAFLKDKLKPLLLEPTRLSELIAKLGSAKEEDWKPAFEELEYFDPRLAADLQTLMTNVPEAPTRQRLVSVLSSRPANLYIGKEVTISAVGNDGFNFRSENGSWWAEHKVSRINAYQKEKKKWNRAVRAIGAPGTHRHARRRGDLEGDGLGTSRSPADQSGKRGFGEAR